MKPDLETTTPPPDLLLDGRLNLRQPASGHRSGTDAILLAASIPETQQGLVMDIGAGAGAAGLAGAVRCRNARFELVEISPELAELARINVIDNNLRDRAQVTCCDVLSASARRAAGLADGLADLVIANPPWLTPGRARLSADPARALAHTALPEGGGAAAGVEGWVRAMAALTKPAGTMTMIHRADALGDILKACEGRFGALAITPIFPREGAPAIRILIAGIKGSRAPLGLAAGLVLHGPDGRFTLQAEAIHRGEKGIGFP